MHCVRLGCQNSLTRALTRAGAVATAHRAGGSTRGAIAAMMTSSARQTPSPYFGGSAVVVSFEATPPRSVKK